MGLEVHFRIRGGKRVPRSQEWSHNKNIYYPFEITGKHIKMDHFPQVGVKIKNIWNHHPDQDERTTSSHTLKTSKVENQLHQSPEGPIRVCYMDVPHRNITIIHKETHPFQAP